MRVVSLVASVLLCSALSVGCDTKKKLDDTLDNANDTIDKASAKLDELSKLAEDLKSDVSGAVKDTGNAASTTLSQLGGSLGGGAGGGGGGGGGVPGIPAGGTGGEVKQSAEKVDLDDDGVPEDVTVVEYEESTLWLADASIYADFFCPTMIWFTTDKPPENVLAWGLYSECGAMACPAAELDDPDVNNCDCVDETASPVDCAALVQYLAGESGGGGGGGGGGGEDPYLPVGGDDDGEYYWCDDGSDAVPGSWICDGEYDCADGSDESPAYCS